MLHFDIDAGQIRNLIDELGVTEKQAKFALSRALRRTATTLRTLSQRGLKSELDIKRAGYIRKRLKTLSFTRATFEGVKLWYGLNDMPVSALRGSIKQTRKGAAFSGKAGQQEFAGGFIRKSARGYGRTILKRQGKERLPLEEAEMPVKDRMDVFVEDNIFDKTEEIFWRYFVQDMTARARYGVGQSDYRQRS